jgi:hypothetical protein
MTGFVDATVRDIDSRISELQDELSRLQGARTALVGGGRAPARPRAAASAASAPARRTRPGRPRGRRGGNTRSTQALELVRKQPGITIPQIAEALKIEPNYLYRVMPKLVTDKLVTREGLGYHPAKADS